MDRNNENMEAIKANEDYREEIRLFFIKTINIKLAKESYIHFMTLIKPSIRTNV